MTTVAPPVAFHSIFVVATHKTSSNNKETTCFSCCYSVHNDR
jgi:hypothetical protein